MIRIQIPATSANLGSGFDSLGIALTMYNQVWMEESDTLDISSKDDVKIPTDHFLGRKTGLREMWPEVTRAKTDSAE